MHIPTIHGAWSLHEEATKDQLNLIGYSAGTGTVLQTYAAMMGGTTGVVTYIYRKYGNIWVGVIPAAIFAGLVTLSGFTLIS